mmetsp:Transcript_74908/g.148376  ORF Transcript_74908/g.148376 Transcript_74908/m.148376 type:complete len:97 (+) Transcript_74908:157-447(+)
MSEGGAGDAGGGAEKQEEGGCKKCCFALLDCIATILRTLLAIWNGFRWCARRCFFPLKECVLSYTDTLARWYKPYLAKHPTHMDVPSFEYGAAAAA